MTNFIEYDGVVQRREGNKILVALRRNAGCAGCRAKAICNAANKGGDTVEVAVEEEDAFEIGDTVLVNCAGRVSRRAIATAFLAPLILTVAVIAITLASGLSEPLAASAGLAAAALWYGALYMLRGRMGERFVFNVRKINNIL